MPPMLFPGVLEVRGDALEQGESLRPGQGIRSNDGRFVLCLHQDGLIGLWRGADPLWVSDQRAARQPGRLTLESDGNLVAYDASENAYWASNTAGVGSPPYRLAMQADGNAVVYARGRRATWDTGTWKNAGAAFKGASMECGSRLNPNEALRSSDGRFTFILQKDSNVVLYEWATPLWASNTWGRNRPGHLIMQSDGNLVAYDPRGAPYWASRTDGRGVGPYRLVMQEDGNAVLLARDGTCLWETHTRQPGRGPGNMNLGRPPDRAPGDVDVDVVRGPAGGSGGRRGGLREAALAQGCVLMPGQSIECGEYRFSLREDADIALARGDLLLWSSETGGKCVPGRLAMQGDGNLVAYDAAGNPFWASNTENRGSAPFKLVMQSDGNCVLYDRNRSPTWDSGTWTTARVRIVGDTLVQGARLAPNDAIRSSNGRFTFVLQTDGNVVLYHWTKPLWASNVTSQGSPRDLVVQSDGKLAATNRAGVRYWSSGGGSAGTGARPFRLVIQEDGNAVLCDSNGCQVWETGTAQVPVGPGGEGAHTSPFGDSLSEGRRLTPGQSIVSADGRFRFSFQPDGKVVLSRGQEPLWDSGTNSERHPAYLTMQRDGNLVAYDVRGRPFWARNTGGVGRGPYKLEMEASGNAVLTGGGGFVIWQTSFNEVLDDFPQVLDQWSPASSSDLLVFEDEAEVTDNAGTRSLPQSSVVESLASEEDETNDAGGSQRQSLCVICLTSPPQGACVPCGHLAGCMRCLSLVQDRDRKCPLCRSHIDQVLRVFIV